MGLAYRLAARLAHRASPAGRRWGASLAGRRDAHRRWVAWGAGPPDAPMLWVHAASVGEALAAEPVVRRLRTAVPTLRVALTHTSPSVTHFPLPWADRVDYLPLDEPLPVATTLDALRPRLLLFSRGDLWPELVGAAAARTIPIAVGGATVRPASLRLRWPTRALLRGTYRHVRFLGAASAEDADRWARLGVPPTAIQVTGDPRHDQLVERLPDLTAIAPLRVWAESRPVLVGGSTEPADEPMLCAWAAMLRTAEHPARLLLVPHDPAEARIQRVARHVTDVDLRAELWSGGDVRGQPDVVVVARRGLLADLYLLAAVAYVGGGFRRGGLHAVAEPAVCGVPVVVGPRWRAFPDAAALLSVGAACALDAAVPRAMPPTVRRWLDDRDARDAAGLAGRGVVASGAASRTAWALARLLDSPTLGRI